MTKLKCHYPQASQIRLALVIHVYGSAHVRSSSFKSLVSMGAAGACALPSCTAMAFTSPTGSFLASLATCNRTALVLSSTNGKAVSSLHVPQDSISFVFQRGVSYHFTSCSTRQLSLVFQQREGCHIMVHKAATMAAYTHHTEYCTYSRPQKQLLRCSFTTFPVE